MLKRLLIIGSIVAIALSTVPPVVQAAPAAHTHLVTVESLRLRVGPSTSDEILATLEEGVGLTVLGKKEGWAQVRWGDLEGWVSAQYLRAEKVQAVDAEFLNLRAKPGLEAAVIELAPYGTELSILEQADGWSKVLYHDQVGWMKSDYLTEPSRISSDLLPETLKPSQIKMVTVEALNVRSGPSTNDERIQMLPGGTLVTVLEEKDRWCRIQFADQEAWVYGEYLVDTNPEAVVEALGGEPGGEPLVNTLPADIAKLQESDQALAAKILPTSAGGDTLVLEEARKYLGIPYVWGGASPEEGFDCSGYVMYLFGQLGVSLPHGAEAISAYGTQVEFANLQPGDVIFFQNTYRYGVSHLGIWAGNNQFIHAPEPGAVVCYEDLKGFYLAHYWGARRITP
ncbi:MAG: SH3 domain-containing protein [Coprothermobacterota bacterium]|nr:SH3 domain-containing protein [Coprothermobacterota bacterium]